MGMFDHLRCHYPLAPAGANACDFQTKDTPRQYLEHYEIRDDGTLWHEEYDTEDHSDPNAEPGSIESFFGCAARVNQRWVREDMTGEVRFYAGGYKGKPRYEFSAYFVGGALQQLVTIDAPPGERA